MSWRKYSKEEINRAVFTALSRNVSYANEIILGVPASHLDEKVFPRGASFLSDAPYLSTMVENPNHIGCHTFGKSEGFFAGTHEIERELINICAVDILKAKSGSVDGYVASGGTEANLEAIWIYRNFFLKQNGGKHSEIAILCSEDSHYSMAKASNLLNIKMLKVPVDRISRQILKQELYLILEKAKEDGIRNIVIVSNMMTTMFGSVDDLSIYIDAVKRFDLNFKVHIDGAYGGFYYPFANPESMLNFQHPEIDSFTLDAHKMAQAPYGTGIFLIRKGMMEYAQTDEASYVEGEDCTIIGSRSGANAIAVWMILATYGPHGWFEKILVLQSRTKWLCDHLEAKGIQFFRDPHSNIVTIDGKDLPHELAYKYHLVPDNHHAPKWFKIVVMEHVLIDKLEQFVNELN